MTLYRLFVLFGILTGDEEEEKMKLKKDNLVVSVETEPGSRELRSQKNLPGSWVFRVTDRRSWKRHRRSAEFP